MSPGLLTLTELRERAAYVLAPVAEDDPPVVQAPVDAIEPPALMLGWEDPWITFRTPCFWEARLAVFCFAGRVEPGSGVATLESLIGYAVARLRADGYSWPHETTRAPRLYEIGGVPLLAARLVYSCPVTLGGAAP